MKMNDGENAKCKRKERKKEFPGLNTYADDAGRILRCGDLIFHLHAQVVLHCVSFCSFFILSLALLTLSLTWNLRVEVRFCGRCNIHFIDSIQNGYWDGTS